MSVVLEVSLSVCGGGGGPFLPVCMVSTGLGTGSFMPFELCQMLLFGSAIVLEGVV